MLMIKRFLAVFVIISFSSTTIFPSIVRANSFTNLPRLGTMMELSPAFVPIQLSGLTLHPENPLKMDFIVSSGDQKLDANQIKAESDRLIKYFLACLAIPEKDQWVNLSPYEKNRIIPDNLGQTVLGEDMLAQDYVLKQLTASLIYPEKELGKKFWDRIYTKAQQMYGANSVPVNTFNKVWILPEQAKVYTHSNTVFVVSSHFKVMLEEDYLALQKNSVVSHNDVASVGANIIREIILPELEREVNEGKNFANLRQIYNSMILAVWFKNHLKDAFLNQVYSNKSKVAGVNTDDPAMKEKLYRQYLEAYKKGVFNYIKEDINQINQQKVARKYFSGGIPGIADSAIVTATAQELRDSAVLSNPIFNVAGDFAMQVNEPTVSLKVYKTGYDKLEMHYAHEVLPILKKIRQNLVKSSISRDGSIYLLRSSYFLDTNLLQRKILNQDIFREHGLVVAYLMEPKVLRSSSTGVKRIDYDPRNYKIKLKGPDFNEARNRLKRRLDRLISSLKNKKSTVDFASIATTPKFEIKEMPGVYIQRNGKKVRYSENAFKEAIGSIKVSLEAGQYNFPNITGVRKEILLAFGATENGNLLALTDGFAKALSKKCDRLARLKFIDEKNKGSREKIDEQNNFFRDLEKERIVFDLDGKKHSINLNSYNDWVIAFRDLEESIELPYREKGELELFINFIEYLRPGTVQKSESNGVKYFKFASLTKLNEALALLPQISPKQLLPIDVKDLIERIKNSGKRVAIVSNVPASDSRTLVLATLNNLPNSIVLKAPVNALTEFLFGQGHPKAIGLTRELLKKVGIEVPENGIIDTSEFDNNKDLIAKLDQLKNLPEFKEMVGENGVIVEELRATNEVLGSKKEKKIKIPGLEIFGEASEEIYRNFHILDLRVVDKYGKEHIVPTYNQYPVITNECTILGVGPETQRVWSEVVNTADYLIVLGDYKNELGNTFNKFKSGQRVYSVNKKDKPTMEALVRTIADNALTVLPNARALMPVHDYKMGQGPLAKNLIKPRYVSEEVFAMLRQAKSQGVVLKIIGYLRGLDGAGSSLDLPDFQRILTDQNTTSFDQLPSTVTITSDQKTTITFEINEENPDGISYEAPDYLGAGKVYTVDGEVDLNGKGRTPKGQLDAPAYIFRNIFGLRGIKIKLEGISPLAKAGGMESSNAFNVALISAASILSGANLSYADIVALAVKLENDEFGGLTGGQGHWSTILGGANQLVWLSGLEGNNYGVATREVLNKEQIKNVGEHMFLVQAGKEYKDGKATTDRTAALVNYMWTDLIKDDELGRGWHASKKPLAAQYAQALADGDFNTIVRVLNQYADIRDRLVGRWLSLMIEAYNDQQNNSSQKEGKEIPEYAYGYADKVFNQENPAYSDYKVVREHYHKLNDLGRGDLFTQISLYSTEDLNIIYDQIGKGTYSVDNNFRARVRKAGGALFDAGAGAPGSIKIVCFPQGKEFAENFYQQEGIEVRNDQRAREIMAGTGVLKMYMPVVVGEPIEISGFDQLIDASGEALQRPQLPQQKDIEIKDVGRKDLAMKTVLFADALSDKEEFEEGLKGAEDRFTIIERKKGEDLGKLINDKKPDIIIVRSATKITAELIALAKLNNPKVRFIRAGAGTDGIVMGAAIEAGVGVDISYGNAQGVASTILSLLAMAHHNPSKLESESQLFWKELVPTPLTEIQEKLADPSSKWGDSSTDVRGEVIKGINARIAELQNPIAALEDLLRNQTIGVWGFGHVAEALIPRLTKTSVVKEIIVANRSFTSTDAPGVKEVQGLKATPIIAKTIEIGLNDMLGQSDVLVIAVSGGKEGATALTAEQLNTSKVRIIVNTARANLLPIDVARKFFQANPEHMLLGDFDLDANWLALAKEFPQQVILLPHVAASTKEGSDGVGRNLAKLLLDHADDALLVLSEDRLRVKFKMTGGQEFNFSAGDIFRAITSLRNLVVSPTFKGDIFASDNEKIRQIICEAYGFNKTSAGISIDKGRVKYNHTAFDKAEFLKILTRIENGLGAEYSQKETTQIELVGAKVTLGKEKRVTLKGPFPEDYSVNEIMKAINLIESKIKVKDEIYAEDLPRRLLFSLSNSIPGAVSFIEGMAIDSTKVMEALSEIKKQLSDDAALAKLPGGISLDTSKSGFKLQEDGQKMNITFNNAAIARFEKGDFSGIEFRILDVSPIISVLPILGLRKEEEAGKIV